MAELPNFMPDTIFETEDEPAETNEGERGSTLTSEQLQEILANERQANADTLRQILQGSAQRGVPLQEDDPLAGLDLKVDVEGLPHPSHDLGGFLNGLQERQGKVIKEALSQVVHQVGNRAAATAAQVSNDQSAQQRAFDLIKEAAPELDDDLIQFSAQRIADTYRNQGIDPMAALRADVQGVAQQVLDYADERFSGRAEPLKRGGGRTGGIPTSRGNRSSPRRQEPEDAGDMVTELKTFQSKARLY